MSDKQTVGFVGLGAMGQGLAANLLKAGYHLRVYNRTPGKARPLIEHGAVQVEQPGDTATAGAIVISMVADDRALEEIVLGEGGLLGRLGRGGVHVSMSTVAPETSRHLAAAHAERGEYFVAAPVFGRPDVAAAGKLNIVLSGIAEARERVKPLLAVLGQATFEFGDDPGAANVVKLAGNFMIASALEAMAEAFTLAEKNGIDRTVIAETFGQTLFACPIYQNYGRLIARKQYEPAGFRLRLGYKDVGLVLRLARANQVPMPLASLVHDRFMASMAKGRGDIDWAGLAMEESEAAGIV